MKLTIAQNLLSYHYPAFLRQAGYTYITSRQTGKDSFVRPLGNNNYPRFHIYVIEIDDNIIFNAHLDQKQASYEGTSAHSGEYDSPLVKQELERLQSLAGSGVIDSARINYKNNKTVDSNVSENKARRFSDIFKNN